MRELLLAVLVFSALAWAACLDANNDGECDLDNCPGVYNPDQADADGDGVGDACDPDSLPSAQPSAAASAAPSTSPSTAPGASPAGSPPQEEVIVTPGASPQATPAASPFASVSNPLELPPRVTPSPSVAVTGPIAEEERGIFSFDLGERTVALPLPFASEIPWILIAVLLTAAVGYWFYRREKEYAEQSG